MSATAETAPFSGIQTREKDQPKTWERAYREGVLAVNPLIADAATDLFSATPTREATLTRQAIAEYVAIELTEASFREQHQIATGVNVSDPDYRRVGADQVLDEITRGKLTALSINKEAALEKATVAWEALVGRNADFETLSLQAQGAVSEDGLTAILRTVNLNMARSASPQGTWQRQEVRPVFAKVHSHLDRVLAQREPSKKAIRDIARLLSPILFDASHDEGFRVSQIANSNEAKALHGIFNGLGAYGKAMLIDSGRGVMRLQKDAPLLKTVDVARRVENELKGVFTIANEREAWEQLSRQDRTALLLLTVHRNDDVEKKTKMLLEYPRLLQVLATLPDSIKPSFSVWEQAGILVHAVSRAGQASAASSVSKGEQFRHALKTFFTVPGSQGQPPEGPRKPNWRRIATAGVIGVGIVTLLAACAGAGTQAPPPPGVTQEPNTPAFTPLPQDTPVLTATPIPQTPFPDAAWTVADFPRVAELLPANSPDVTQYVNPTDFANSTEQLIAIEQADPRCQGQLCDALVAVSYIDGGQQDARVAYFLKSPDNAVFVAVRNSDGSFNLAQSEWVPQLTTYTGEVLKPEWFFDFTFSDDKPVAADGGAAISRLGFVDKDSNVVALMISPFGDGITQVLVKDSLRFLGPDFPAVAGREFVLFVDHNGQVSAGYVQYGADGQILLGTPAMAADGKTAGMYKFTNGKWEFMANALPPTPTPKPPEATATPVVKEPTSCVDFDAQQQVVDTFLKSSGFANIEDALTSHESQFGPTTVTFFYQNFDEFPKRIFIDNPLLLGTTKVKLGPGGDYIICVVIGYRDRNQNARVITASVSTTIDGVWSGPPWLNGLVNDAGSTLFQLTETEFQSLLRDLISGKRQLKDIELRVAFQQDDMGDGAYFGLNPYKDSMYQRYLFGRLVAKSHIAHNQEWFDLLADPTNGDAKGQPELAEVMQLLAQLDDTDENITGIPVAEMQFK